MFLLLFVLPLDPKSLFIPGLDFEAASAAIWKYQLEQNAVLKTFCNRMDTREQLFMPIEFFKHFEVKSGEGWEPEAVFKSSGTSGQISSRHLVRDLELYRSSLIAGYEFFYGRSRRAIFALLPHYLERGDSSLVYMVKEWIAHFGLPGSGFYLYEHAQLEHALKGAAKRGERILLIGVAYALMDFVEQFPLQLPPDTLVMETGGMKGRKEELTREALHGILKTGFGISAIHSEYGMTELLSQAYAQEPGRFRCPPWMKVVITDVYQHEVILPAGRAGRINLIDLANLHSCSFLQTQDQGVMHPDGSFEVLGRLDHAEMRGCNLMYTG